MRNNLDLAVALLLDDDEVAEVADAALDLYPLLKELGEGADVEDLVVGGLRGVDDELYPGQRGVPRAPIVMGRGWDWRPTFFVVFWALPDFFCNEGRKTLAYCFTA